MKLHLPLEVPVGDAVLFGVSHAFYYLSFSGAILLVAVGIFFWALLIRKRRKRKFRHHWHSSSRKNSPGPSVAEEPPRRKRKRRSEPPLNPTLAETRGLPPRRDGQGDSPQLSQH